MSAPSVPIAYAVADQPPVVQVVAPADLAEGKFSEMKTECIDM